MKNLINLIILGIFVLLMNTACEKEKQEPHNYVVCPGPIIPDTNQVKLSVDSCVLIPIGQLREKGSLVDLYINDSLISFDIIEDGLGGSWAHLPNHIFPNECRLKIRINRRLRPLQYMHLRNDSTFAYLKSSTHINWTDYDLRLAAGSVYDADKSITENAIAIQEFVRERITFNSSYTNSFGEFTASHTYLDQRGVCINFARVFIALCRASNIKARSVSGVIYLPGEVGTDCFHHHEWAEFLDEENRWRSIDLTYSSDLDITNIHYIDFTYGNEETEIFSNHFRKYMGDAGMPFRTSQQVVVPYAYLPFLDQARFGFVLVDDQRPESIVFEKEMSIRKSNDILILNHL